MEESLNITMHDIDPRVKDFIEKPAGPMKNVEYYENLQNTPIRRTSLLRKDGNLYFSSTMFIIKRNMQYYYLRPKNKLGFTLNEKGKLSIWFGKPVQEIQPYIHDIFKNLNIDWVNQLPDNYHQFITKITLEKILNGKITNPIDFCAQLLKNWRVKTGSPRVLYNTLMTPKHKNFSNFSVTTLTTAVSVAKNYDHYLNFLTKRLDSISRYNFSDLEMQAVVLDRKIDYTWSEKRLEEEHQKWTKEIMTLKKGSLSKEPIEKLNWFTDNQHLLSSEFTLLNTEAMIYDEGTDMSHCLYTNYSSYIKRGGYVAYHVKHYTEEVTLGIFIKSNCLGIDQIQTKGNKRPSSNTEIFIIESLEALFKAYEFEKPFIKETEEELVDLPF